jgi:hypothetical protein
MRGKTNGAVAKADCENDSIGFFRPQLFGEHNISSLLYRVRERHVILWRPGLGKIEIENYHAGAGSVEGLDQARMQGARPAIRIIRELEALRRFAVDSDDYRIAGCLCGAS